MLRIFLLLITGLLQLVAHAQNVDGWRGTVLDEKTGAGVEGVTIFNTGTAETVISNESGIFKLVKGAAPTDTLVVSSIHFQTASLLVAQLTKGAGNILLKQKEIELREIVVAATPNAQHRIISKIDIKLRNINNTQEVLRMVPGLVIGQHAGGGKAEQIFLRGFDIDHGTDIALAVDGIPVNMVSHAHGQGYADLHFLIPELIQDVNFKKGTYYPEKGNFTTTGYVDFKTMDRLAGSSVKVEGGMFNTFRTVGLFDVLGQRTKERGHSFYIGSEYIYTRGYFDDPQDFNRVNLFGKYNGKLNDKNVFNATASFFNSQWNASGQIPERAVADGSIGFFGAIDPTEGGKTGRANVNLQLLTTLPNNSLLKNQLYYSKYDFELFSNFTFFANDPVNGDQIKQKERRHMMGYNGSYATTTYASATAITSEAGVNVRFDKTDDSELSRTIGKTVTAEQVMLGYIEETNLSAYINETFVFNPRFTASIGLRYDYFINQYKDGLRARNDKATAGIVSPKINLQYNVNQQVQWYLSAGKGFHSNDTRVAVAQRGLQVLPAAYGADAGLVWKPAKNLFLHTALWYLWLEQEFVYVGDEGIFEPSGKSRRYGVDVSARYQPLNWLFADVDLAYAKPRSVEAPKGEDYLPLAPLFTSAGGVTVKPGKGWSGSVRYRYMGARPANEDYSITAKGYFVTDAMLNYTIQKFELGLLVQNLLNVRWKETQFETESRLRNEPAPVSEIHFTPGTPFFFKASLTYNF